MKKLIFIILPVFFIVASGVFVYKEVHAKPEINSGLSDRGKRFLSSQNGKNAGLEDVDFNKKSDLRGEKIEIDGCFSFIMPFSVRFSRTDGECNVAYGTDLPRGTLVIYKTNAAMSDFNSVPGVSLRRLENKKYKEEEREIKGKKFLFFKSVQDEQVLNAFYYESDFYFVANFIGSTSEETKAKMIKLLETVEFL